MLSAGAAPWICDGQGCKSAETRRDRKRRFARSRWAGRQPGSGWRGWPDGLSAPRDESCPPLLLPVRDLCQGGGWNDHHIHLFQPHTLDPPGVCRRRHGCVPCERSPACHVLRLPERAGFSGPDDTLSGRARFSRPPASHGGYPGRGRDAPFRCFPDGARVRRIGVGHGSPCRGLSKPSSAEDRRPPRVSEHAATGPLPGHRS